MKRKRCLCRELETFANAKLRHAGLESGDGKQTSPQSELSAFHLLYREV